MSWDRPLPFFTKKELACRHCGQLKLNALFAAGLVTLRFMWALPLHPTSVCRCQHHNEKVGGHPKSLHMTNNPHHDTDGCAAADFSWKSWPTHEKLRFAALAYRLGFSVGLNEIFCHVDMRARIKIGKSQAIFLYSNWQGDFTPDDIRSYDNEET